MSYPRKINLGLLIMRLGLAGLLFYYAIPKILGGAQSWQNVGTSFNIFNVGISAKAFGLAILSIQVTGGIAMITGFFFSVFSIALTIIYAIICLYYFNKGYVNLTSFALAIAAVFLGLMYTGAGDYIIAVKLKLKEKS